MGRTHRRALRGAGNDDLERHHPGRYRIRVLYPRSVSAFFFVDSVWQIYVLAVFLNLGSALFTPIYKAVIPGVATEKLYPKALVIGSVAYDVSSILRPTLVGLLIATIGFRDSFLVDAGTFALSALLVIVLPRAAIEVSNATRTTPWHVGWGLTYPLAGVLTTEIGFANAGWIFSALLFGVALPFWLSHSGSRQGGDNETRSREE